MMGAGKTTVGRRLARTLGRPFIDSDQQLETRTGRTVRQIFEAEGEPAFRAIESDVLADALDTTAPSVIAAAGGTVLSEANRARMRDAGTVVWLRADPTVLADRVRRGAHRPLLADDPARTLRTLDAARRDLYQEVADHIVDTSERALDDVLTELLELVRPERPSEREARPERPSERES